MLEKLELIKNDGTKINADLIAEFEVDVNNAKRRYSLYTLNETDQNGLIKILASEITDGKLIKIASDEEWTVVKNVMRAIISSTPGEFTYIIPTTLSFNVDDEYARVIAVQDVAKDALVKDYEEKRPQVDASTTGVVQENKVEDPNAVIYPAGNINVPIGSEISPGINEVAPQKEENSEDDMPIIPPIIPIPNNTEVINSPIPNVNPVHNNNARDMLIQDIVAAVDKYLSSVSDNTKNKEIDTLKNNIATMQAQLQAMTESLK